MILILGAVEWLALDMEIDGSSSNVVLSQVGLEIEIVALVLVLDAAVVRGSWIAAATEWAVADIGFGVFSSNVVPYHWQKTAAVAMEWLGRNMGQAVGDQKGLEGVIVVAEDGGRAAMAFGNEGWFQDAASWEEEGWSSSSSNGREQNGDE